MAAAVTPPVLYSESFLKNSRVNIVGILVYLGCLKVTALVKFLIIPGCCSLRGHKVNRSIMSKKENFRRK